MKKNKIYDIIHIIMLILPFIYAIYAVANITGEIPAHYGIDGNVNRYGSKYELFLLPVLNTIMGLILFVVTRKQKNMPNFNIYNTTRHLIAFTFGAISFIITYTAINNLKVLSASTGVLFGLNFMQLLTIAFGILFIVLGNILPKSKRNKYIGFKVKWTVENDIVWQKTNRMAGIFFFISGVITIFLALFVKNFWIIAFPIASVVEILITGSYYAYTLSKELN